MEKSKDPNAEAGTVKVERVLDAPVKKVWQALTDSDTMKKWYFNVSDFKPVVGQEFSFEGGPPEKIYKHLCKIITLEKERRIAYTWRYKGYQGESTVTFELEPEGNKTRIRVIHTGLDSFPSSEPDFGAHNFSAGWTEIITKNLPAFLAQN
jgi:uncharacterized protein YndB with AHSA1/START domain